MSSYHQMKAAEFIIDAAPVAKRHMRNLKGTINTAVSKANPVFIQPETVKRLVKISSLMDQLSRELDALEFEAHEDRAKLIAPGLVS